MRKLIALVAAGLVLGAGGTAIAASTVNQTVTYEVQAVNELAVSGTPTLTIDSATAGSDLNAATDGTSTYAITTNQTGKITGVLNSVLPAGVTLTASLAAPAGAASAGAVALTATPADLVTGVSKLFDPSKTITYNLAASVTAGVVASDTRTVTYTIVIP